VGVGIALGRDVDVVEMGRILGAKEKTEIGDVTGKTLYTNKAKAIIAELSNSLVMDAGEISQNLRQLYEFTISSLVDADVHDDLNAYGNAEKVIEILSDGWKEMQKAEAL